MMSAMSLSECNLCLAMVTGGAGGENWWGGMFNCLLPYENNNSFDKRQHIYVTVCQFQYSIHNIWLTIYLMFSRYMVSFSPTPEISEEPQAIIWEIFTGEKKRGFHCHNAASWPIFKWNKNGNYFARMTPHTLSIYETPVIMLSAPLYTNVCLVMVLEFKSFELMLFISKY